MSTPSRPASPPGVEPEYLTPADVSTLLQVHLKTVYRWASEDPTMPALRVRGTVRFPKARLLLWLKGQEQGLPRQRFLKPLSSDPQVRVTTGRGPRARRAIGPSVGPSAADGAVTPVPER